MLLAQGGMVDFRLSIIFRMLPSGFLGEKITPFLTT